MEIGIIADTHSLLRKEVEEELRNCDVILHAGDIASQECYEKINALGEVYFVRGNADKEWAEKLPRDLTLVLGGRTFYMVHNIKHMRKDLQGVDFVVYGHSHRYEEKKEGEITYLNPGSCGPRRFIQPVTMMRMSLMDAGRACRIEKKDFSPTLRRGMKYPPQKDMDKLIQNIVKDMDAARPVEEIAKRNRVEEELVREILQIYTTHPGIDVDGILNRMK